MSTLKLTAVLQAAASEPPIKLSQHPYFDLVVVFGALVVLGICAWLVESSRPRSPQPKSTTFGNAIEFFLIVVIFVILLLMSRD